MTEFLCPGAQNGGGCAQETAGQGSCLQVHRWGRGHSAVILLLIESKLKIKTIIIEQQ